MTLDVKARALALRLIGKFGKSVTYTTVATGSYSPATGAVALSEVAYIIKAVIELFGRHYGDGFMTGLVLEGDRKISFAAQGLAFVPKPGDKVTFDGDTFTALAVSPVYSGELVALYAVHGRK